MKFGSAAAYVMSLCFGALLVTTSVNCVGAADDELDDEAALDEGEAVTRLSGFTSFNIYKGVPATSVKCDLDPQRFGLMVTAIRHDIFSKTSNVCGKCVKVTSKATGGGNGKSVTVRVIDESNDFSSNGGKRLLDMAPEAFQKIGNTDAGSIPVSFQFVTCPTNLK